MADQNWGPADSQTEAGGATTTNNGGAFGTAELRGAMPTSDDQIVTSATEPINWANPVPYDYTAYAKNDSGGHKWDSNVKVYEWNGEEGDIGPEFPDLEIELFGQPDKRQDGRGIDFKGISEIELTQEGPTRVQPIATFKDAGLHPAMLKNVQLAGYDVPTPIQRYCLPAIHLGYDVIGIAQTGSGKTAAFLIPILNKLMGKAKKLAAPRPNPATFVEGVSPRVRAEPLVVIVSPTRELAVQIFNEARKFCYRTMLRPCVVYGGGGFREQEEQLQKGCDVLIATPGRLIHFINNPQTLTLRRVRYMVIDEADEMLMDDWKDDLTTIMSGGEQEEGNINYMLFSATFPKGARDLARTHLAETHVRLRVGRAGSSHTNIKQTIVYVDPSLKRQALIDLIKSLPPTRTIIFVNSKRAAEEVDDFLFKEGMPCTSMHSDRNQLEREAAMRGFRSGKWPILVTTGVTARGIDVRNVMHVVNYDLPSIDHGGIEEYTHRIGRTGRIGHRGLATSFYSDRDEPLASVLTRTLMETNQEIPDFLEKYVPEGATKENLKFEADSDFEEDMYGSGGAGGAYGADGTDGADGADGGWAAGGGDAGDAAAGGSDWNKAGGDNAEGASGWGASGSTEPEVHNW
ncbi:P-loop containing nucleoside triphosphate hydrolase protein [Dichotomopilus funicola]|uniref:RNA helicase n=1 Tax=Dichotomopilus funicola TaxID=1934379 RepID=A0AAN6V5U7_9PEZI|nr:P-loop containing nucleoside triphosphate hydrolase protein [Dichotomopilus funicola]